MLKLILCLTVIGASLSIGVFLSSRLNARVKIISELIVLIEEASVKMTYTADPLAVLFNDNFAGYSFRSDQPFSQQFKEMTRQYKDSLQPEDLQILDDFSDGLGTSDTVSQLRHMRLYLTMLNQQLSEAREVSAQKGKLYLILPLSAGIAAAILLI